MSTEDIAVLNKARDLLQDYDEQRIVGKNLLVELLQVWNKLKRIEFPSVPFSFEQIGECEIEAIRGRIADIILMKAAKIAF